jgi:hypothetical protein
MPIGRWTNKDERQGEIAARTVNKTRREQRRQENRRTMGTGNPYPPRDTRMRDKPYSLAQELEIPGRSKMTKRDRARALQPVPAARLRHANVE